MSSLTGSSFEERSHIWRRVVFEFKGYEPILGSIRDSPGPGRAISGSLPIISEAIVLDNIEILIKLSPTLKTRLSRRFHTAEPGDIIYRPQIPALSIFADYYDIYEPVERIGTIMREEREKVSKIVMDAKSILFVRILRAERGGVSVAEEESAENR